ncbi:hypothetical protein [Sphingomonas sp.]|uniref:hypothetical protein n=1 Tax=Sphingomonas sp. TaxID=28214 RepID=UPI00286D8E76|nr:hypothetical protein [Sphingomonas sp.]
MLATLFLAFAAQAAAAAPPPPCAAAEYRQMDFWVGTWDLEFDNPDGSLGKAENVITADYGGCAIVERFRQLGGGPAGGDYLGTSTSIYDAQTKSWRQMWVDNGGSMFDLRGGPVIGQKHSFELVNIEPRGPKQATMRMIWEDVAKDSLTWRWQARQADGSWSDSWVLRYRRRK